MKTYEVVNCEFFLHCMYELTGNDTKASELICLILEGRERGHEHVRKL